MFGGAIGAMHIPEKWFPGSLDYYFNSHNIMHILVVVAVYSMHLVRLNYRARMSVNNRLADWTACCDFQLSTIVPSIAGIF